MGNVSSWQFYASRGYECFATFYNSITNESYTINTEDGGMVSEECNIFSTFDSVNITIQDAHYGCYTHVRFDAPNTNSQAFVLRIEAEMDDISTRFGTYKKSWSFGNLSITPLICSSFSNIIPLKSPIIMSNNSNYKTLSTNELISLKYNYIFMLINISNINYFELNLLLGGVANNNYSEYNWEISVNELDCKLENIKLSQSIDCSNNENYNNLFEVLTDQLTIWISWDPNNKEFDQKTFSFGMGSELYKNTIASLLMYDSNNNNNNLEITSHANIDYITFVPPKYSMENIIILPIQFSMPKICLSQIYSSNKLDLHHTWNDDCNEVGWELRKYSNILEDDTISFYNESNIDQCQITDLNNGGNAATNKCFHGPFKGSSVTDFGDYISRYFYVYTDIEYDIIEVNLNYYGLCTWNPEQYEDDTAYVFINDEALWKSAPKYEFVNEYCEGYSLYSDWTLYTEYLNILNPQLIQCLYLLDQICAYPLSFTFRHKSEKHLYFSIGMSAKLNQAIGNEAFGFSDVELSYKTCPNIESMPIGNITYQPLQDMNRIFRNGDMLVISSNSIYYLVAEVLLDDNITQCLFTLYGGYRMWSQLSINCTIAGLPIMSDYSIVLYSNDNSGGGGTVIKNTFDLGISINGFLSLRLHSTGKQLWSRRTHCESNNAYAYYSINKTNSLGYFANSIDNSIYSIDCTWALIVTKQGEINVIKNINSTDGDHEIDDGEIIWRKKGNENSEIQSLVFEFDGSVNLYDFDDNYIEQLSPIGADFMIFDSGKLALIDHNNNKIIKQFDFDYKQCDQNIGPYYIKYLYFMKQADILYNNEALISENCMYKLVVKDANLMILNENNSIIWQAINYTNNNNNNNNKADKFEFQKDGNMVLYSYVNNEILWQTDTSTLFDNDNIFYADRAILNNNGEFFIIDNATLTIQYQLFDNTQNKLEIEYNYNLNCESNKYDFIDKRWGFYATWISYYNCLDNNYVSNKSTECIAYKYCPIVQHYENLFLQPSSAETNCRKYASDYWRSISNNYVFFQVSIANTEVSLSHPKLYVLLSKDLSVTFGNELEFDDTLLMIISSRERIITLKSKYYEETFGIHHLFRNQDKKEWISIQWDVNFDYIYIGDSQFISSTIYETKYSLFFKHKIKNPIGYLFDYINFAWDTNINKCYGEIIIQIPPINVEIPKGCFDNITQPKRYIEPIYNTTEMTMTTTITQTIETEIIATNPLSDNIKNKNKSDAVIIIVVVLIVLLLIAGIILGVLYYKKKKTQPQVNGIDVGVNGIDVVSDTGTVIEMGNVTSPTGTETVTSPAGIDGTETVEDENKNDENESESDDEMPIPLADVKRQKSLIIDNSDDDMVDDLNDDMIDEMHDNTLNNPDLLNKESTHL